MKKIAIIGASYLQEPLIEKAKDMGYETHVFAWKANDIGERTADHFYPISIIEKEEILNTCRDIGIDGIATIASDLAAVTVNYVAENMGLIGNTIKATENSTNKHQMRMCFEVNGDPSPKSLLVSSMDDLSHVDLHYPIIIKPTDRSGSRGISKLYDAKGLSEAIEAAKEQSFEKKALVEEFAVGKEYSVEFVSYKGEHHFLAMTKKYTTGSPHFIETGHLEPAPVSEETLETVKQVVSHALTSLGIEYGASHTELKIAKDGTIRIIEIGGRMGGDFIGSDLVHISTGIDFVKAVVDIAMGNAPDLKPDREKKCAGIRFIFNQEDVEAYQRLKKEHPDWIVSSQVKEPEGHEVTDSASRFGYFLMQADRQEDLLRYLPERDGYEEDER
jgi:biotin carboxylase